MDAERDRAISEHVVRMHRYRAPGEQDGEGGCQILIVFNYLLLFLALPIAFGSDVLTTMDIDGGQSESDGKSSIFEKYDPVFHGKKSSAKKRVHIS